MFFLLFASILARKLFKTICKLNAFQLLFDTVAGGTSTGKTAYRLFPVYLTIVFICSELAMILSMAQTNPVMFEMVEDTSDVSKQVERMRQLKELLETNEDELRQKQRDDWVRWVSLYR